MLKLKNIGLTLDSSLFLIPHIQSFCLLLEHILLIFNEGSFIRYSLPEMLTT